MAKSRVIWITRDARDDCGYRLWPYREVPKLSNATSNYFGKANHCGYRFIRKDEFEPATGITLKPGQRIKARLVIA